MASSRQLVVIGAGPAGATAALFATRAGLDVLLVDKRRFPRDKICGDAIARKSLGVLRELGIDFGDAVREPIARAVLTSPAGHRIEVDLSTRDEPAPHLVCRREIFDAVILRAAREQVDVWEDTGVTDLLRDGMKVRGVICRHNGVDREVPASIVIGADGFDSVIARRLGFYKHDPRWYVATRGYYRDLDVAPRTVEVHFVHETLPGFLWIFPTGDGIANVGIGLVHGDIKKRHARLRDVHEAVLALPRFRVRFARASRIGTVHGWNLPTPDFSRTLCGDGFLLAGDAAGLVDPFSGEGIGNAVVSGKLAADVAGEVARGGSSASYAERLRSAIDENEIKLHYRLRHLARHARLIDVLVGRAAAHPDVLNWIRGMTAANDTLTTKRSLLSPLTYARLWMRGKTSR
jgi:geranylgeranyl reductase family protein